MLLTKPVPQQRPFTRSPAPPHCHTNNSSGNALQSLSSGQTQWKSHMNLRTQKKSLKGEDMESVGKQQCIDSTNLAAGDGVEERNFKLTRRIRCVHVPQVSSFTALQQTDTHKHTYIHTGECLISCPLDYLLSRKLKQFHKPSATKLEGTVQLELPHVTLIPFTFN